MSKAYGLVLIQFVLFAVIGGGYFALPRNTPTPQFVAGFIVVIIGLAIGLYAIWEHGRVNKSGPNAVPTPRKDAELITSGLYRWVRHPIYTGVLAVGFGVAIAHGHIVIVVASILLLILLTYKSMYEEELLRAQYEGYADYMQATGRFLPKIM